MKALLILAIVVLGRSGFALPNYYYFEHEYKIGNHSFTAVIILPAYYSRNFGQWDELDYELKEQDQHPIPDREILPKLQALQKKLWSTYEQAPFLAGRGLDSSEFDLFHLIERFDDGRGPVFSVIKKVGEGDIAKGHFSIQSMVRMTSPVDVTTTQRVDQALQLYLPFHLRALRTEKGRKQLEQNPPHLYEVGLENAEGGLTQLFTEAKASLGRTEVDIQWWDGVPIEIKAWNHNPIVVDGQLIDFLPGTLELAMMYGGFERTGISLASVVTKDAQALAHREQICSLLSKLQKKPVGPKVLGVRAGQYWIQSMELPLVEREIRDFGMELRMQFEDPDFTGFTNHILWADRKTLIPALKKWASSRPGAKLLPSTRLSLSRLAGSVCSKIIGDLGGEEFSGPNWDLMGFAISPLKPKP